MKKQEQKKCNHFAFSMVVIGLLSALCGRLYYSRTIKCHEDGELIFKRDSVSVQVKDWRATQNYKDTYYYCAKHAPECDYVENECCNEKPLIYWNHPKDFQVNKEGVKPIEPHIWFTDHIHTQYLYTVEYRTNYIIGPAAVYVTNIVEKPLELKNYWFTNLTVQTNSIMLLTITNQGRLY